MHFDPAQCKQKGAVYLYIVLGLLIVSLIIGSFYFFFIVKKDTEPTGTISKSLPSKSQKLYKSEKLQLEFEHPKNLTVSEDSEEEFNKRGNGNYRKNFTGYVGYEPEKFTGALALTDNKEAKPFEDSPFTVWVFDNPDNLAIDDWYDRYWYYPFVWGDFTYNGKSKYAPEKEATISGQIAKYNVVDYQQGKPKFYYLSGNKKMYLFKITDEAIEEVVIPSFKLLDSSFSEEEKIKIEVWIKDNNLNQFGDPKDLMYAGGTPLFNEATGEKIDRYEYILKRYPDRPWNK